jgi:NADPH:quinone reductase-like Zn-dependent oxidoreductase
MKAIATTDFGAPVTLVEISAPEPGEGEILVRVASSSINGLASTTSPRATPCSAS